MTRTGEGKERTPLVVHVVHTLRVGGMENGLVNLINRTPPGAFRHAVVCLTDYSDFAARIQQPDVPVLALGKREGKDPGAYLRLWRLLRGLGPDIVHTRNLAALEAQLPAALAGVPCRIHGEHGRDMIDLTGGNRKYRWLRRGYRPLIHRFIALSGELETYLRQGVGVAPRRLSRIANGVDVDRFRPAQGERRDPLPGGFAPAGSVVVGWVGRMEAVKAPLALARAFARVVANRPDLRSRLRLVMVGGGSLYRQVRAELGTEGVRGLAWLPGEREDIPDLLRCLDLFVLPSLAEGISNTVLEAMASGLPVAATRVGGNPELVVDGETGTVIDPGDADALPTALAAYAEDPARLREQGWSARIRVERGFSLEAMVGAYLDVYREVLAGRGKSPAASGPAVEPR